MKNKDVLKLSRNFWDNYKLFLKEELTREDLVKYIENLDDLVFYRENCDHHFCDWACLDKVLEKSLDTVVDWTLTKLREAPPSRQKKILKKLLKVPFEVTRKNALALKKK
jgi:hypothetical protein